MPTQRTIVYVDGFNLYYGSLKDTPYRWLDPMALCRRLLKEHQEVVAIKYFAARVKDRPDNPGQAARQQAYLRALETIPELELIFGQYHTNIATRVLAGSPPNAPRFRQVIETREKGSDVNLASQLLIDHFRARADLAVVISNDSDLKRPIEFLRGEGVPVAVFNPRRKRSFALSPEPMPRGSFYKCIRTPHLKQTQLPETLQDAHGTIVRPPEWGVDQRVLPKETRARRRRKGSKKRESRPEAASHAPPPK